MPNRLPDLDDDYPIRPPWVPMLVIAAFGALLLAASVLYAIGVDWSGHGTVVEMTGWRSR